MTKNIKLAKLNIATVFLHIQTEDNVIEYKCLYCNKNYEQHFHEKLKKQFFKYIQIT